MRQSRAASCTCTFCGSCNMAAATASTPATCTGMATRFDPVLLEYPVRQMRWHHNFQTNASTQLPAASNPLLPVPLTFAMCHWLARHTSPSPRTSAIKHRQAAAWTHEWPKDRMADTRAATPPEDAIASRASSSDQHRRAIISRVCTTAGRLCWAAGAADAWRSPDRTLSTCTAR
jgi:hypothetical protein